jgi:RNA polymerase sigma factor (sigma-70 family)
MVQPTHMGAAAETEAVEDFDCFFRTHHLRLFQALYLLTGDVHEADDITQEALLRTYERWDRVSSMDSAAGYVFRTAMNVYRSRLRRLAVRARHTFASLPSDDPSGSIAIGQDVRNALRSISDEQRQALILVEWLGLDSDEAGRVLGIDASSVRGRLHRGRAALRELLGDVDG